MAGQLGQSRQGRGTAEFQNHQKNAFSRPGKLKMLVLGTAQSQRMAGQLGQSRQGRGTAEFQNHQKNAFSRPGKLKMLVLELLKARAWQSSSGRAGRAGAQHSSKTTKKTLFQGLGSSKCWFWNCSTLDGIYLRVMVRSAFKKCTPDSREGSTFPYATCSVKKFPRPWNCNVVFLT